MSRNWSTWLVYLFIGLAAIGFTVTLFTDTFGLIRSLLFSLIIGAIIFGAFYFLFLRKRSTNELKKYRKAVKQSKQKYKTNFTRKSSTATKPKPTFTANKSPLKHRKNAPHLRVIEGNANNKKRKNRASL
ncbi:MULTISPECIES: SA1362 family protein [Gracilibacillus]|uniref:Uncharacterized protein n=1 Tax=Gracilibacillus dipsosauri TaxID=178340 RepID=A0A317L0G0_9BACI|nr:SA1362 family protein [Gracilibacillus dipsosauri]PWU68540.1 hypothetical protein DLJ74_08870 [Gracilibacillus dipsosauri]